VIARRVEFHDPAEGLGARVHIGRLNRRAGQQLPGLELVRGQLHQPAEPLRGCLLVAVLDRHLAQHLHRHRVPGIALECGSVLLLRLPVLPLHEVDGAEQDAESRIARIGSHAAFVHVLGLFHLRLAVRSDLLRQSGSGGLAVVLAHLLVGIGALEGREVGGYGDETLNRAFLQVKKQNQRSGHEERACPHPGNARVRRRR